MDPWNILGWMLVGMFGLILFIPALKALVVIIEFIGDAFGYGHRLLQGLWKHFRTRNIKPQEGDSWRYYPYGLFDYYTVKKVTDEGVVGIRSKSASWGMKPSGWTKAVKNRRMYLSNRRK